MVTAVHSCIAWVYSDWVIRLPAVIKQSRSEVQNVPDDYYTHTHTHTHTHTYNLRGSNTNGTIEPPQIRLAPGALVVLPLLFTLSKSTEYKGIFWPIIYLKLSCNITSAKYLLIQRVAVYWCWCQEAGLVQELLLMWIRKVCKWHINQNLTCLTRYCRFKVPI